ncbi:GNAT family N-acetyltransferase [Clostridiaceae bacterium M8S5]|nr:GNAT family N-acetyltransferase [Clostridiaceae bacterium M8S5]
MKYTLTRSTNELIDILDEPYNISKLNLTGDVLIAFLDNILSSVMKGIVDPDIVGKSPRKFIENLIFGKLGNFQECHILVANNKEAETIGILIMMPDKNSVCNIWSVGVNQNLRGLGIGTKLISRAISQAKHSGYKEITINVHSENKQALKLYKSLGFCITEI